MHYLICDIGTYSFKYAVIWVSKKKIKFHTIDEVIYPNDINTLDYIQTIDFCIEYIRNNNLATYKVYFNLSENQLSSRYLQVPATNKKKASQMIPFMLEEQIAFSISEIHYSQVFSFESSTDLHLLTQFIRHDYLQEIYNNLEKNNFFPNILSSNLFALNSNIKQYSKDICIMDIGHNFTNIYAVHNNELISDQTFHFGGKYITDIISEVYNISQDEAIIFKHRNSFFLTEIQYLDQELDEDQRDFAKLMEQLLQPVITEINRFRLSTRVHKNFSIETIYLTGGTSKIKNICEFMEEKIGVHFDHLSEWQKQSKIGAKNVINLDINFNIFNASSALKIKGASFLHGCFSPKNQEEIPLLNLSLLASRLLVSAVILLLAILVDNFLIVYPKNKKISRLLLSISKKSSLKITRKDIRLLKRSPERFYKKFKSLENKQLTENNSLDNFQIKDAMDNLIKVSTILPLKNNQTMIKFVSQSNLARAQIQVQEQDDLKELKSILKRLHLQDMKMFSSDKKNVLDMSFKL